MDLRERLDALGMSYGDFASQLGISKSAVGNMASRGELTQKAEDKLLELETGGPGFAIGLGNLVRDDAGQLRIVVRRDRREFLTGRVSWVYHCSLAREQDDGWLRTGQVAPFPGALLKDLGQVKLSDMVKK